MRITFSGVYSRLSSLTIASRMTSRFSTKLKKPIKPSVIAEKMSAGRHLLVDDRRVDPIADRRSNSETCSLRWISLPHESARWEPPTENAKFIHSPEEQTLGWKKLTDEEQSDDRSVSAASIKSNGGFSKSGYSCAQSRYPRPPTNPRKSNMRRGSGELSTFFLSMRIAHPSKDCLCISRCFHADCGAFIDLERIVCLIAL